MHVESIDIAPTFKRFCAVLPLEALQRLVVGLAGDDGPVISQARQTAAVLLQERLLQKE